MAQVAADSLVANGRSREEQAHGDVNRKMKAVVAGGSVQVGLAGSWVSLNPVVALVGLVGQGLAVQP